MKFKNIIICLLIINSFSYAQDASMWNKVKSQSSSLWNTTKEKVQDVDSEDIKNGPKKGYETTKEYGSKAWNYSKEKYNTLTKENKK